MIIYHDSNLLSVVVEVIIAIMAEHTALEYTYMGYVTGSAPCSLTNF